MLHRNLTEKETIRIRVQAVKNLLAFEQDPEKRKALQAKIMAFSQGLTERSYELFLAYAKDAGNWSGNPLVGGNVGGSKEDRGNITQLKRAGLITTFVDDERKDLTWISFTDGGKALAELAGVDTEDWGGF